MGEALWGFAWYHLPNELQKTVCISINQSQNGPTFAIGPFEDLDFECAFVV